MDRRPRARVSPLDRRVFDRMGSDLFHRYSIRSFISVAAPVAVGGDLNFRGRLDRRLAVSRRFPAVFVERFWLPPGVVFFSPQDRRLEEFSATEDRQQWQADDLFDWHPSRAAKMETASARRSRSRAGA